MPRRVERPYHTKDQTEAVLAVLARRSTRPGARRQERQSWRVIWLAVSLGLRPGEVRHLRWARVDLAAAELRVCSAIDWDPKADSARTMPLEPELVSMLRVAWLEAGRPADGWVFPNRDDPDRALVSIKKGLASACTEAGVPVLSPHALRRTAATRWLAMGVDIPTAMRLGGWRTPDVLLEVYAQTNVARQREAIERTAPRGALPRPG